MLAFFGASHRLPNGFSVCALPIWGVTLPIFAARTNVPQIHQLVGEVLDTLAIGTHEIRDHEGCWWSLTIRPYRTVDHRIEGAVLTFANVDSLKRSLQAAEESRDYADAIVETVRESLVVFGPDLRIERVNRAFQQTFQVEKDRERGQFALSIRWRPMGYPAAPSST